MIGVKDVRIVKSQELPDPDFSTVKSPNPEEKEGFKYAIEMAKEKSADLIFATDPDSDRIGVVVKDSNGDYITLNGNQVGVLLTEYILRNKKELGTLSNKGVIIKTIVTTSMIYPIANEYNVEVMDVLTGFKFIAEKIKDFEDNGYYKDYIFGFEESYGYLAGTYARDKDAVVAAMLIAEMAADYKEKGLTLYEGLNSLYEKYGYFLEISKSYVFEGIDGTWKMSDIMEKFRKSDISEIAGSKVISKMDVQEGIITYTDCAKTEKIDLPKSNVLKFNLENNSWIAIRPSGTEPKIKFYFGVCEKSMECAKDKTDKYISEINKYM
jgi:phosphoglucomutase